MTKVTFNSAGNTVISSSHDGSIKIWNANRGRAQYVLGSHGSVVEAAAHSPDHRRFATCGRDGNINIYSTDTGEKLTQLQSNRGWVLDLVFSTDSSKLLAGNLDGTACIWDLQLCTATATLDKHSDRVHAVAWSEDEDEFDILATGSWDGTIAFWSENGELLSTIHDPADDVFSLAFIPNRKRILSAGRDGHIRLWDYSTGALLSTFTGHTGPVQSLVVFQSPSKQLMLLSASEDQTLRIWNLQTGEATQTLVGHVNSVMNAAITPDSRRIISASYDDTLKIWDTTTGNLILTLRGHDAPVYSITVLRNNQRVISGGADGQVLCWDPNIDSSYDAQ